MDAGRRVTKTTIFLTGLLNMGSYRNCISSYIGDANTSSMFDGNIYILCSKEYLPYESNPNYLKHYNTEDGNVMYVMSCKGFEDEYLNFIEGKYSKFSEEAKKKLLSQIDNGKKRIEDSNLYAVLYKTEARRLKLEKKLDVKLDKDAELASIINVREEVYDWERI